MVVCLRHTVHVHAQLQRTPPINHRSDQPQGDHVHEKSNKMKAKRTPRFQYHTGN